MRRIPVLARGGGAILYTSSGAAYAGEPQRVAYAMSKSAGHALMRHVAAKYGPHGVRANSIAPGIIKHERWADWSADVLSELEANAFNFGLEGLLEFGHSKTEARSRLVVGQNGSKVELRESVS